MEQKSMTALVSAFARAYHATNNDLKIFNDYLAKVILSEQEYNQIASIMSQGIKFFNPTFEGTEEEALRWIVDNQLSPSPLGRAAFAEKALENSVEMGAEQYLILAAGYDTFGYRQPSWAEKLQIFELEHPITLQDKQNRLGKACIEIANNVHFIKSDFTKGDWDKHLLELSIFDKRKISFCSLLGISYYLPKETLESLLNKLSMLIPQGSTITFDYPDENTYTDQAGVRTKKQLALAVKANEKMLGSYSFSQLESLLSKNNFIISQHLTPNEITIKYFDNYNRVNCGHKITAFDNVNYCLATKK
ncbi:class I SAM-dependent methyltransferase [Desulfosporosinus nitroreducens]|uniref:S-adenosyl-L-methionine-dependent methyltransferase n=1 Tax=Desulfosporosinus nitroreducens TaxID=2018668 RepID=A0ABT8R0P1_9FIRM|nr:class I SAM-dependent methyltransferase [Desulfosporosinus nitroreducens]MDO0825858.1 class I SAM-dependent methyltransferase [Desulfosporosinus nitroreducens]